jgi:glycosyltransferase involved in cell wall biosynthesis
VPRLIAQSPRVAEIYAARGVDTRNMTTIPFTLSHIARLRPRTIERPPSPVIFVTLNGCASPTKGSEVVAGALRLLRERGLEDRFVMRVHGYVYAEQRAELESHPAVELRGLYTPDELDAILDDADVGLLPSIWEEAFGYAGMEMVAKGIPLIANPRGGVVQYARDGQTAWHNRSCTPGELADLMAALIEHPERVVERHRTLMAARDELIVSMDRHVDTLEQIYADLAGQSSSVR